MKKIFLFFIGMLISTMTFAADVVVIENLNTYTGSEPYVYNKADGKIYAYNSLNEYEEYGVFTEVETLKVASGTDKAIDFIETYAGISPFPYINTGYTHTANTRVVVECIIYDTPEGSPGDYNWQAVFGARGGITNRAFMFFNRQGGNDRGGYVVGTKEQWGEDGNNIPHNQRVVIDCQGHEGKVFFASDYPDGEPAITIYNDSEPADGNCPMMVFTNNNNADRQGSDTHYGSSCALMRLYSFKVYEGEETEPVAEYEPYIFITGQTGLKEKFSGKRCPAEEGEFQLPDGVSRDDVSGGIAVYPGKRVIYTDGNEYKWNGTEWEKLGEPVPYQYNLPEGATNYKNMMLWTCPEGKYSCFGIPHGDNQTYTTNIDGEEVDKTAYYDAENDVNVFPHYIGTGMHEPIGCYVPVEKGNRYRYTFDFGSAGWDCTWTSTTMHAGVLTKADLGNNNFTENCTALGGSNGVLANWKLDTNATLDDDGNVIAGEHVTMEFIAPSDEVILFFPFGYVSDDKDFLFKIGGFNLEEYSFPDPYNDINIYRPELEVLLETVGEYDPSNTTDKLAAELTAAIATAKAALNGDDQEAQKNAIKALKAAYNAAAAINISNLRKTTELAEAEGITENIAEAKAFFVDGEDSNVSNDLLNKLRIARRVHHSERQANVFTGTEPEDFLDVYIYNVGQQRFLCGGEDWGAHAAIGFPGTEVTLYEALDEEGNPAEGYEIDTHLNNGGENEYLNYGGYMDTGNRDPWKFVPVEGKNGVYNIVRVNENTAADRGSLLGFRKGSWNVIDTDMQGADDPDNQWILVTKAERTALISSATASNPVDLTFLIKAPGFNQRDEVEAWQTDPSDVFGKGTWGRNNNYPDFVWECWNGGNEKPELYLYQDVELPAAGWYILGVQGYYRDGNTTNQVAVLDEGGEKAQNTIFSAYGSRDFEGASIPLWNITDEQFVNKAPGWGYSSENYGQFPNSCTDAYQYFQVGQYWNTLKVYVPESELDLFEIALERYGEVAVLEDWTVVDNFRLAYTGQEEPDLTGVKNIVEVANKQNTKIYNLQGMEVKNTKANGIYIVNGKKVVMK